jgi:hypothetical protein
MPARKIAWLSASISLSMLSTLQKSPASKTPVQKSSFRRAISKPLGVPYELVGVDYAGDTAAFSAFTGFVGPHHPSLALDGDVFLTAGHFRGQSDFKFHRRTDFHRRIGADVHSRRAKISGDSFRVSASFALMDLNRQFQRESFSGPCFFPHGTSSKLACSQFPVCEIEANVLKTSSKNVKSKLAAGADPLFCSRAVISRNVTLVKA